MALKKLDDIEKRKQDFIESAPADKYTGKQKSVKTEISKSVNTDLRKYGKPKKLDIFTKQTISLDKKRYLKINNYCKSNKISFQDLMVNLIDKFLKEGK